MAPQLLPDDVINGLFKDIENTVDIIPDPIFASDKQRGFMNYRGIQPETYLGPFKNRPHLNDTIANAIQFANEFGRAHRDEKNQAKQPASGKRLEIYILQYEMPTALVFQI